MAEAARSEKHIIEIREVWKTYRMGDEEVHALRGVTLDVIRGEYLSIMGPSGSGKTTLFNMIGALDSPSKGHVLVNGHDMGSLSQEQVAYLRCHSVGYIFQSFNLIPVMTALENVSLPMVFAGMGRKEYEDKAAAKLEMVGLQDRLHHKPYELSGGQQQRVAIARAMANDPALILADEPTGNLDLKTGQDIIEICMRLREESGVTIVSNTHDHKMLGASDRVVDLRDGQVERIRRSDEIDIQEGHIEGIEGVEV
ncbi:TPA: ABC transporter [Candidatus Latescibacteria bacterium]|nr:ABC transporter [Gemmatimonadota bacterium]HAA77540.1 ABC transporter [Candidatus Latescibacterota bacterium]|tara:strand:- start:908 stop:1669 length:762 start_codon:yes stop_codon:yes gene_type:complete